MFNKKITNKKSAVWWNKAYRKKIKYLIQSRLK